jgi:hypothetical protein
MDALAALFSKPEKIIDELVPYMTVGPFGPMIHHPLLIEIVVDPEHAAMINQRFKVIKESAEKLWKDGNYAGYVFRHERPYRLEAFARCMSHLNSKQYWQMLGSVWIDSENIWQHQKLWKSLWNSKTPNKEFVMDEEDRGYLTRLPDNIRVYRGVNRASNQKGLSWTLDREKAKWFSTRFTSAKTKSRLIIAEVDKKHVHAYLSGRSENEIVADKVKVLEIVK